MGLTGHGFLLSLLLLQHTTLSVGVKSDLVLHLYAFCLEVQRFLYAIYNYFELHTSTPYNTFIFTFEFCPQTSYSPHIAWVSEVLLVLIMLM